MSISPEENLAQALRLTRVLLESRRKASQANVDSARTYGRYSQLAGHAGITSALDEALQLVASIEASGSLSTAGGVMMKTFMRRQAECDQERDKALTEERYSEVATLDGQGTGFLMAVRIVQDEFQPAKKLGHKPKR